VAKDPAVDPEQVIRWAEQAVAGDRNAWYLHVLGAAHYRAGHLDEAIRRLDESEAANWAEEGRAQNRLVLAMAHLRLGHADRARALLDGVHRWWQRVEAGATDGSVAVFPTDWLPLQLLRAEAEGLIVGPSGGLPGSAGSGRGRAAAIP
jgi:hypothetical protein